jgi:hypothetical protein
MSIKSNAPRNLFILVTFVGASIVVMVESLQGLNKNPPLHNNMPQKYTQIDTKCTFFKIKINVKFT